MISACDVFARDRSTSDSWRYRREGAAARVSDGAGASDTAHVGTRSALCGHGNARRGSMTTPLQLVQERLGDLLLLRLNRPDVRNALSWELMTALGESLVAAETDPDIRAVVITGAGDRAFCSGEDLRSVANAESPPAVPDGFLRLLTGELSVPIVAAVNGVALAAGFEIVLGCDVVVASSLAHFGLPEVKRGLFAGSGVLHIAHRLPLGIALQLALTGDLIDATRAHGLGLVSAVVPPDRVLGTAIDTAERIASNAPLALAATKELVRRAAYREADTDDRWRYWLNRVFTSADAREGARAFIEKRTPVWRDRV